MRGPARGLAPETDMPWFYSALSLISIACTVHVILTRRPLYWLLMLWIAPGVGAAVYFFVEVFPDLQRSRTVSQLGSGLATAVDPGRHVRRLEEELEISDTIRNRQSLAKAYAEARRFDQAIEMYRSCLKGIYADDPPILLALAEAQFLNESFAEASETVARLEKADGNFRHLERRLLNARILEALGRSNDALAEYESLAKHYPGEEVRCRYALLLMQTGRQDQAREVFERILLSARRSPRYYRAAQREWIQTAKQQVKD